MSRAILVAAAVLLPAAASATSLGLLPGEWQFNSRIVKADMPGMPPSMAKMMAGKVTSLKTCITPEQAQRDPRSVFQNSKGQCQYKNFSMAGGRLSFVMSCAGGTTMSATGTYSPTGYSTHSTMVSNGPRGKMTMVSDGTGKLLGPCRKK